MLELGRWDLCSTAEFQPHELSILVTGNITIVLCTATECTTHHIVDTSQARSELVAALQYIPIHKAMEDEGTRLGSIDHMVETL